MSDKVPDWVSDNAKLIALAAAGQVHDNEDARCVEVLVGKLVSTELLSAYRRGRDEAADHCDAAAKGRYTQSADAKDHRAYSAARDFESMAMQAVQNAAAIRRLGEAE